MDGLPLPEWLAGKLWEWESTHLRVAKVKKNSALENCHLLYIILLLFKLARGLLLHPIPTPGKMKSKQMATICQFLYIYARLCVCAILSCQAHGQPTLPQWREVPSANIVGFFGLCNLLSSAGRRESYPFPCLHWRQGGSGRLIVSATAFGW